jgi:hypothetical protein
MNISKPILSAAGSVVALLLLTSHVSAGTTEALAGCKAGIYEDSRLASFSDVYTTTDTIKRKSRFTRFEIDVRARTADGEEVSWDATCEASGSGKVKSIELVRVGGTTEAKVAQAGS